MSSSFVTLIRNLHDRKGRRREARALAEGVRIVEEAVAAGVPIHGVLLDADAASDTRRDALVAQLAAANVTIERVPARDFAGLAATDTPQGIVAVVEPPIAELAALDPARGPLLVLDAVQDPGNVGALLRAAWGLGAGGAILLKGTADPFNAKVVRAAMGATFRLPLVMCDAPELIPWLSTNDVPLWAAAMDGTPVANARLPRRLALAVGNEGAGVSEAIASAARGRVAIPLATGVESLNVAVAAGILLHEVGRVH